MSQIQWGFLNRPMTANTKENWLRKFYLAKPKAVAKAANQARTHIASSKCVNYADLAFAEAFEVSEYGGRFDPSDFNFVDKNN